MFRFAQITFAHYALNTIRVFTQSGVAKHLAFSAAHEDEILRLSPQDDIAAQSLARESDDSLFLELRDLAVVIAQGF